MMLRIKPSQIPIIWNNWMEMEKINAVRKSPKSKSIILFKILIGGVFLFSGWISILMFYHLFAENFPNQVDAVVMSGIIKSNFCNAISCLIVQIEI